MLYYKIYNILKVFQSINGQPVSSDTLKNVFYLLQEYIDYPYQLRFGIYNNKLYSHELDLYLETLMIFGHIKIDTNGLYILTTEGLNFIKEMEQNPNKLKEMTGLEQPVIFSTNVIEFIQQCVQSDPYVVSKMAVERYLDRAKPKLFVNK